MRGSVKRTVLFSAVGSLFAVTAHAAGPAAASTAAHIYGPVRPNEDLTQVANVVRPGSTRLSTFQTMLALYRSNPGAFAGSPGKLKSGSMLRVPQAEVILAMPAAEAYAVYRTTAAGASSGVMAANTTPASVSVAPPAASPATPEIRRPPGEQRPVVEDTQPLPDPNRIGRLAPVAAPDAWSAAEIAPVPDRWRLLNTLGMVPQHWYDPYNQNTWKADKPIRNGNEFINLSAISDSVYEYRIVPTPAGPGENRLFGRERQMTFATNLILSAVYYKGDTTFKPPEYEFHLTPVLNYNYNKVQEDGVLFADPSRGRERSDQFIGLQEAFVDYHLRNVSDRYDFDSVRFGIQPFSSDFRGFLFQDNQLALRFFGNRDNNRWQYNAAWIRRLSKNTDSGLNDVTVGPRNDDIFLLNLYHQDFPSPGFTSQLTLAHNRNRENGTPFFDDNGFLQRPEPVGSELPRKYQVTYLGYNGDGHFGRLNLTVSSYVDIGHQDRGVFTDQARRIQGEFGAAEASWDIDWLRLRASAVYASGDHDPHNGVATGFDAIFENPLIAGADTSFWIRQGIALQGGSVNLTQPNGVLADLRSSKDAGQSNFENPGIILTGLGADADLMPQLRLSGNFNHLWFDSTETLALARDVQFRSNSIGWDLSTALIYRPFFTQNIIVRVSGAMLVPDDAYRTLYPDKYQYSVLGNLIVTY